MANLSIANQRCELFNKVSPFTLAVERLEPMGSIFAAAVQRKPGHLNAPVRRGRPPQVAAHSAPAYARVRPTTLSAQTTLKHPLRAAIDGMTSAHPSYSGLRYK